MRMLFRARILLFGWMLGITTQVEASGFLSLEPPQEQQLLRSLERSHTALSRGFDYDRENPEKWIERNLLSAFEVLFSQAAYASPDTSAEQWKERFVEALEKGKSRRTELQQILKELHAHTLDEFLSSFRQQITFHQRQVRQFLALQNQGLHVRNSLQRSFVLLDQTRLSGEELAAVIFFYSQLSEKNESLLVGDIKERISVKRATDAIAVLKWPGLKSRPHGVNAPALEYSPSLRESFRSYWLAFEALGLTPQMHELSTQLINQNAGNARFRQVRGLEEIVLGNIRKLALDGDLYFAKRLFLAFLNNYSSSLSRDSRVTSSSQASLFESKPKILSLSQFIENFSKLTHPVALERFFQTGELPSTRLFPRQTKELDWNESLKFSSADFSDFARSERFSYSHYPFVKSIQLQRAVAFFRFQNVLEKGPRVSGCAKVLRNWKAKTTL